MADAHITTKQCSQCKETKSVNYFWRAKHCKDGFNPACKECANATDRARWPGRRDKREPQLVAYRMENPEKYRRFSKQWREKFPEKVEQNKQWQRLKALKVRRQIIHHYSSGTNQCACCGESRFEFLVIDHTNGGGGKHRKEHKLTGSNRLANWLLKNDMPEGFRILCHNCNMCRGAYGYCPHEHPDMTPEESRIRRVNHSE